MQRVSLLVLCLTLSLQPLLMANSVSAQEEAEEGPRFLPGLTATYQSGDVLRSRLDDGISFDWGNATPDVRLSPETFHVRWSGSLYVQRDARYVLSVYVLGTVTVVLDGKPLLQGGAAKPTWIHSAPIELSYSHLPLTIDFAKTSKDALVKLFWECEQFEREPIPPQSLLHEDGNKEEVAISSRGDSLVRAHRCAACHEIPDAADVLRAPSLIKIKDTIRPDWLVDYLQKPAHGKRDVTMPDFGLSSKEAEAIAAYLWARSESVKLSKHKRGSPENGKEITEQVGCLACHGIHEIGQNPLFGGGDLTRISAKRPERFFAAWLRAPVLVNPDHRMPTVELSTEEIANVATYLASLGFTDKTGKVDVSDPAVVGLGKVLIESKRCTACHAISGFADQKAARLPWHITSKPVNLGCLETPDAARHRPGYRFDESETAAIAAFLAELPAQAAVVGPTVGGKRLLEENNCLSCHSRGESAGLREVVVSLGVTDAKKQASLVPPSLNAVGDKLTNEWLAEAVQGKVTRLRPWLAPRMPKFTHRINDTRALVDYFVSTDRIPADDQSKSSAPEISDQEMLFAAHRLVGANGFGCMSCHTIGSHEPIGVEPGARGSDLRFLEKRMREPWFRRWTRNPARIVTGSEMPSITLASPGVLDGDIDRQIDALWHGLNAATLVLPTADAVQTLVATAVDPVIILRDVIEHTPKDHTSRPFAVGFVNGHNLLVDLDTLSVRQWWVGDFARQKTRGKSWYWEPAGLTLLGQPEGLSFVALTKDGKIIEPRSAEQAIGRLQYFERTTEGATFRVRLCFEDSINVAVDCHLSSTSEGVKLTLTVTGVPADHGVVFRQRVPVKGTEVRVGQVRLDTDVGPARVAIRAAAGGWSTASSDSEKQVVTFPLHAESKAWKGSLLLASAARPPAAIAKPTIPPTISKPKALPVVPGYEAVRLAVPEGPMPTGMAFATDGTMVVSDLKGGVYTVIDSDKDGDLDEYRLISDHLAAPYGLLVEGNDVIVSDKQELLRLKDALSPVAPRRSEVLATGWGVTSDYHDWTVGLVRDREGAYYVAPSCQQDERDPRAALSRGKVLKIEPDGEAKEYAAGIRFAMGIAQNEKGDLFTTDNQGVTNPFNELNHIRPGHHYGFWSKLEPRPKGQVTTPAAIQIPHPWSRSVNGIAFVPPGDAFGPFAGHIIGAEYTTRGLIRLSLQQVGDTYQGCAYPFSDVTQEQLTRDETFLGPIAVGFDPKGDLYVGSMIDSGWGGGNNRGTLERVRFAGSIPFGIREVRGHSKGFDIDFTTTADTELAADVAQYTLSCYQRIPQGEYATADQDRTSVKVVQAMPSSDGRSVRLIVEPMKPGFVYDIAIGKLKDDEAKAFPSIAYYTLNEIP